MDNQAKQKRQSVYDVLSHIDLTDKIKKKNGMSYLPWSVAWSIMKQHFPNSTYRIIEQITDDYGNTRPWYSDGKTGWVKVGVTPIGTGEYEGEGIEHIEELAIMDFKMKSMPADAITSVDVNKSQKRCLVKACAFHGLGTYIYSGEELPESVTKANNLRLKIAELAKKKCALSEKAKKKVAELCREAEKKANPDLPEESITGQYNNIEDEKILDTLRKQLMAIKE